MFKTQYYVQQLNLEKLFFFLASVDLSVVEQNIEKKKNGEVPQAKNLVSWSHDTKQKVERRQAKEKQRRGLFNSF